MAYKKSLSLLSWAILQPLKSAVISFLLLLLFTFLAGMTLPNLSGTVTTWCTILAIVVSAFITLYKMPRENMDRRGFVALNNAHYIIGSTIFVIIISLLMAYKDFIIYRFMLLSTNFTPTVLLLIGVFALICLYLVGIFVVNLYAKYLRCREMGISRWKIICSMPFGFTMMWTPGYLLNDEQKNNAAVSIHSKLYSKINNVITGNFFYTLLTLILITIYSGFFYGPNIVVLALISFLIFSVWFKFAGLSTFRQQQNRVYAYTAIIINVIVIVSVIAYAAMSVEPNVTMNINDTIPAETIAQ